MKRIFSVLMSIVVMTMACSAQKTNVPKAVTDTFTAKFPTATNVKWGKESAKEYEAEFKMNNTDVSANFGKDGSWMETETIISVSKLPEAVINAISAKYPGYVILQSEKIEKPEAILLYEVNIKVNGKKKELEFDANGNFVN